ncbi:MAG: ACP S-malonyltransferase, partial [Elusimicrobiota bacterium]|nr:ACP S-malonyltransferase [Elusimicrobiota bacterium]
MSDNIFVYPGQGAQQVGMGKEFIAPGSIAENIWDQANSIVGYDLKEKVLNGPSSELVRTAITQSAVYITEIIIYKEFLNSGIKPVAVAGHSLGEYAAVVSSGALRWEEGLRLVKFRGELFEKAGEENPGGMLAVIGLEEDNLKEVLDSAGGIAQIVNYNSPGQLVVSAEKSLMNKLRKDIKTAGAKLVVPLKVSGGFHSALMDPAFEKMKDKLNKADIKAPQIKLY